MQPGSFVYDRRTIMAIIYPSSKKKKSIALLLCFFLGIFGAHRFYLGKPKTGALYLIGWGLEGIGGVYPELRSILESFL